MHILLFNGTILICMYILRFSNISWIGLNYNKLKAKITADFPQLKMSLESLISVIKMNVLGASCTTTT